MFALSQEAGSYLAERLAQVDAKVGEEAGAVFRIEVSKEKGPELGLGRQGKEDFCFDHGGRTVLALDHLAAQALDDRTLVFDKAQEQLQLQPA